MSVSESEVESIRPDWRIGVEIDPAHSMVLPTLDFSASFPVALTSPGSASPPLISRQPSDLSMGDALSDLAFHNAWASSIHPQEDARSDSDRFSDVMSESSWVETMYRPEPSAMHAPPSERSWFGFSSEFMGRMADQEGPREELF